MKNSSHYLQHTGLIIIWDTYNIHGFLQTWQAINDKQIDSHRTLYVSDIFLS